MAAANKCWLVYTSDAVADHSWSNITFFLNFYYLGFDLSWDAIGELDFNLYNANGPILRIRAGWIVYPDNICRGAIGANLAAKEVELRKADDAGVHIDIFQWDHNKTFGIEISNLSKDPGFTQCYYETINNFAYITNGTLQMNTGSNPQDWFMIDNVTILPGSAPGMDYLWDIPYPSFGTVINTSNNYITHTFNGIQTVVDETRYQLWNPGYMVKQVALAVNDTSDIDDIETWLRIGDGFLAERDAYYTDSARQRIVIVWENVNYTHVLNNLDIEFKFVCTDSKNMHVLWSTDDIDENGILQFKFSNDNDNFNGVYDGDTTMTLDCNIRFGIVGVVRKAIPLLMFIMKVMLLKV